jgi:hypothetical protein
MPRRGATARSTGRGRIADPATRARAWRGRRDRAVDAFPPVPTEPSYPLAAALSGPSRGEHPLYWAKNLFQSTYLSTLVQWTNIVKAHEPRPRRGDGGCARGTPQLGPFCGAARVPATASRAGSSGRSRDGSRGRRAAAVRAAQGEESWQPHLPLGTRRLSSSVQFCTTTMPVPDGLAPVMPGTSIMRKRPSRATSYEPTFGFGDIK